MTTIGNHPGMVASSARHSHDVRAVEHEIGARRRRSTSGATQRMAVPAVQRMLATRWSKLVVWDAVFETLATLGPPRDEEHAIDSTIMRAHQHGRRRKRMWFWHDQSAQMYPAFRWQVSSGIALTTVVAGYGIKRTRPVPQDNPCCQISIPC